MNLDLTCIQTESVGEYTMASDGNAGAVNSSRGAGDHIPLIANVCSEPYDRDALLKFHTTVMVSIDEWDASDCLFRFTLNMEQATEDLFNDNLSHPDEPRGVVAVEYKLWVPADKVQDVRDRFLALKGDLTVQFS